MPTCRRFVALLSLTVALLSACGGADRGGRTDNATQDDAGKTVGGIPSEHVASDDFSYDEVRLAAEHMDVWATGLASAMDEAYDLPGDPHWQAADVLAHVDFLLREHAALTSYATHVNVSDGQDAEAFVAAANAVGENSSALGQEFLTLFDKETEEEFLTMWELQVDQYFRYAKAGRLDDEAGKRTAMEELETKFVKPFAEFMEDVTVGVAEPRAVEAATTAHVRSQTEVIEAQQAGGGEWFAVQKRATDDMKNLADEVTAPIVEHLRLEGTVAAEAVTYRAELSGRMAETALFVGYATRAVLDGRDAQVEAAVALLDENTKELRETFARHAPRDTADDVAELWTEHNDLFLDYARAQAQGDDAEPADVLDRLSAWSKEFGTVVEEATRGKMSALTAEKEAAKHVETVIAVIDAQAKALRTG